MSTRRSLFALFALIILEGYVVLSSELLAIRMTIPFVGSGTDTVSIIIAAVLMPLAFGYHAGGRFKPGYKNTWHSGRIYISVRDKLLSNMLTSLIFLLFTLSYGFLDFFFFGLIETGFKNRLGLISLYSALFLVVPVYLLGQTIPLTCNFFSRERLAKITGRILFFSTIGSFLGAVLSTLVLMGTIGVNNTAIINFVILGLLITWFSKEWISIRLILTWALILAGIVANSNQAMRDMFIVENNQYNTIKVQEFGTDRHMFINNNASSMYNNSGGKHEYIDFIERVALDPIFNAEQPKDILVLGAGAFTLGAEDQTNIYDFVDIDESLLEIAEQRILQRPVGNNVIFHPVPARAFLMETDKKYDVIVLDAYSGGLSLPEHLATQEFFQQVKDRLKDNGKMLANMAVSPNFASKLSRNVDNTIRSVFPHVSRAAVFENYALWEGQENMIANVIYIYQHWPDAEEDKDIYTDNKNKVFLDRPARRP